MPSLFPACVCRLSALVASVLLLVFGFGVSPSAADYDNYLVQPVQIYVDDLLPDEFPIEMTVNKKTVPIRDHNGLLVATTDIRSFTYENQSGYSFNTFMGPTLRVSRGTMMDLLLINDLTGVGRLDTIEPSITANTDRGRYKDPDVVNLHVHGLHVSPAVDDVLLYTNPHCPNYTTALNIFGIESMLNLTESDYLTDFVPKMDCYLDGVSNDTEVWHSRAYPYQIPLNHYPGTHWYHTHWHGSVTFQIVQGLYGFIIIEDEPEFSPELAHGFEEKQIFFGFTWLHTSERCDSGNFTDVYTRPAIPSTKYPFNFPVQSVCKIYRHGNTSLTFNGTLAEYQADGYYTQMDFSSVPFSVTPSANVAASEWAAMNSADGTRIYLVNGQIKPSLRMTTAKWYHFRMCDTIMNYLFFWIRNDTAEFRDENSTYANCDFHVMGQDGIYFEDGPRDLYALPYQNNQVIIQPGARADLAVRCACNKAYGESCVYDIWAYGSTQSFGTYGVAPFPLTPKTLMYLSVESASTLAPMANLTSWSPEPYNRTDYLLETRTMARAEVTSFCQPKGYAGADMSQCNIVHGRTGYPAGTGNTYTGSNSTVPIYQDFYQNVAINQQQFNPATPTATICTGAAVTREWAVTANYHPFHHHTWPFQVQRDITQGWIAVAGDWRDTVGSSGTFRARSNYRTPEESWNTGVLIIHCHYVPHEDHGMMAFFPFMNTAQCAAAMASGGYANKFIVTSNASDAVLSAENGAPVDTFMAVNSSADYGYTCAGSAGRTAVVHIQAVDVNTNVSVVFTVAEDCYLHIAVAISPRTADLGNLWFALGFGGASYVSASAFERDAFFYHSSAAQSVAMEGDGVVFSLQSDGATSLTELYVQEIAMDAQLRATSHLYGDDAALTYFECYNYTNLGGARVEIACRHPMFEGSEVYRAVAEALEQNFIYAYGEGRFLANYTYHSTRGGCHFEYGSRVTCVHDPSEVSFVVETDLPPTPEETSEIADEGGRWCGEWSFRSAGVKCAVLFVFGLLLARL